MSGARVSRLAERTIVVTDTLRPKRNNCENRKKMVIPVVRNSILAVTAFSQYVEELDMFWCATDFNEKQSFSF